MIEEKSNYQKMTDDYTSEEIDEFDNRELVVEGSLINALREKTHQISN